MKRRCWPYELHVYPGQGHGFTGAADRDSMRRTADWFDRQLNAG